MILLDVPLAISGPLILATGWGNRVPAGLTELPFAKGASGSDDDLSGPPLASDVKHVKIERNLSLYGS